MLTHAKQPKFSPSNASLDASHVERRKLNKSSAVVAAARGVGCSVKEQHECKEF
jgi:hypothetical protein